MARRTLMDRRQVVSCNVSAEEIDQEGPWMLQPLVTLPGNMTLPGTSVQMTIRARFR
jgi:hypothetical protein